MMLGLWSRQRRCPQEGVGAGSGAARRRELEQAAALTAGGRRTARVGFCKEANQQPRIEIGS